MRREERKDRKNRPAKANGGRRSRFVYSEAYLEGGANRGIDAEK